MTRRLLAVVLSFCAIAVWVGVMAVPAHAAINKQISFQGKLTNTDGTNVTDGTFSVRFRIYTDPSADAANTCAANSCKWEETQGSVSVSGGVFQVNLGSVASLPASVDFNTSALYLGVKVGADAEMTPRIQLTAAPYAFNTDLFDGMDSSAFVQLSPGSQQSGNINVSGTVTSGAVNGITIGNTIQPSAAGALSIQSNGTNALNLDTGGAAGINIGVTGTSVTAITVGNTTSNPNIAFNGSGTFGTTTGTVSLNGNVTVASGKNLTLTSGSFTQTYSANTASNAHGIGVTNTNTGAGVIINGVNITPTNTSTATSGTNVLNGVNFAAGGALGGTDQTNGINFASATGYTNFINSPSFILSSAGAVSGVTTISTSGTINTNTFSSSTLTFGAAATATVQSAASQALTITGNAASTWSTTAGNITVQAGSGTVSLGSSTVLTASGALNINSATTNALTLDSGTTGGINLGTNSNAKTITIGNNTGATVIANLVGTSTTAFKVQGPSSAIYLNIDSTNNRLYVGNPTADTTAFLLVLDYKNTTGDPTVVAANNGGEYYNSANNKFRCQQNSIWSDCINGFNTSLLTADQAATQSSTTMQNVTALGFPAAASTTYVFDAWIPVNDSNATADLKYTFTTPTGATLNILTDYYSSATANVICNITASATACANTTINLANHFIEVRGTVANSTTAGTVQFQFAQNTSTAASFPVIKKGATITWRQSN
jgi:hypothetical protein